MEYLKTESGIFGIDDEGTLRWFDAEPTTEERILKKLIIPEGVVTIPDDSFRRYTVLEKLRFPGSLRVLGTNDGCAFANCRLPDVVLPESLESLGTFVFGNSTMRSLHIPKGLRSRYFRQFKGSHIETLYLPRLLENPNLARYSDMNDDSGFGFLHGLGGDIQAKTIVYVD